MIKPNELRIWNMVDTPSGTKKITGIVSGKQIGVVYFNNSDNDHLGTHLLTPIHLTPEILLKCGFELFPWGWVKKSSKDFGVRLNIQTFNYDVSGNNPVQIKYLHQLQNLYFSLTGEEVNYYNI